MSNDKRRWNVYGSFITGIAVGFEMFPDERGGTCFGIQCFFFRFLITKDILL